MQILNSESFCSSCVFCQINEVWSWIVFYEVSAELQLTL